MTLLKDMTEALAGAKPQTDPKASGLSTSEGKMHAVVVMLGTLLAVGMPILTALHDTFPNNPWLGFAFTVLGAFVALQAARTHGAQRTELKQTLLVAEVKTAMADAVAARSADPE